MMRGHGLPVQARVGHVPLEIGEAVVVLRPHFSLPGQHAGHINVLQVEDRFCERGLEQGLGRPFAHQVRGAGEVVRVDLAGVHVGRRVPLVVRVPDHPGAANQIAQQQVTVVEDLLDDFALQKFQIDVHVVVGLQREPG